MALLLITGVAGTGKTLYSIQKYIIPELIEGGQIFTNIDNIRLSRLSMFYNLDIIKLEKQFHQLVNPKRFWEEATKNSIIVLDEAQNVFNNRDWQNIDNNDCIKYLMEHRHYGHSVVMITPHIDSVDAGIRRVAEFTYKHRSFSAIGSKTTVKCAIFTNANTNQEPLKIFTWHHDRRIYDCYSSYFDEQTIEKKPKVNVFLDLKLILLFLFCFAMIFFASNNLPKVAKMFSKPKTVKQQSSYVNKVRSVSVTNYIKINDSTLSDIQSTYKEYRK